MRHYPSSPVAQACYTSRLLPTPTTTVPVTVHLRRSHHGHPESGIFRVEASCQSFTILRGVAFSDIYHDLHQRKQALRTIQSQRHTQGRQTPVSVALIAYYASRVHYVGCGCPLLLIAVSGQPPAKTLATILSKPKRGRPLVNELHQL